MRAPSDHPDSGSNGRKPVPFVPPLDMICDYLKLEQKALQRPGEETLVIKVELLRLLLQTALLSLPFSADWYVTTYPDIRDAFEAGKIIDLREHFLSTGFFEGRLGAPPEMNEEWYLEQFPDVRKAMRAGEVPSAARHYETVGVREWRAPRPEVIEEIRRWRTALLR